MYFWTEIDAIDSVWVGAKDEQMDAFCHVLS